MWPYTSPDIFCVWRMKQQMLVQQTIPVILLKIEATDHRDTRKNRGPEELQGYWWNVKATAGPSQRAESQILCVRLLYTSHHTSTEPWFSEEENTEQTNKTKKKTWSMIFILVRISFIFYVALLLVLFCLSIRKCVGILSGLLFISYK